MNSSAHPSPSPRSPWLRGDMWIGPVSGLGAAVIVNVLWRWLKLPYRPEFVLGSDFFIMIAVTAYINGGWRAHPWRVMLLLILCPSIVAMLIHFAM